MFPAFCLIVRTSPIHFALLGRKRKYIKSKTTAKLVRQTNLDRRGLRPIPIICHLLDPPSFSLPTTFKKRWIGRVTSPPPHKSWFAFKIKITPYYLTIPLVYLQNTLNLSIKRRHLFPALLQEESSVLFWLTGTKILMFNPKCESLDVTCILLDLHCGLTSLSISWWKRTSV